MMKHFVMMYTILVTVAVTPLYSMQESEAEKNQKAFHAALWSDNKKKVNIEEYINKGVDVNSDLGAGYRPLHKVCGDGNLEEVNTLIKHGADVNAPGPDGQSALHYLLFAIGITPEKGTESAIIRALARAGANMNTHSITNQLTPLHMAALGLPSQDIMVALLACGCNPTLVNRYGKTVVQYAQEHFEQNIERDKRYSRKERCIRLLPSATLHENFQRLLEQLPHYQALCNAICTHNYEALMPSLKQSLELAQAWSDAHEKTTAHFIALNGDRKTAQVLIPHFTTQLAMKDVTGSTPLMVAQEHDNKEVCVYLNTVINRLQQQELTESYESFEYAIGQQVATPVQASAKTDKRVS